MTAQALTQQVDADPITQEQLDPLARDYESDSAKKDLTPQQDAFREQVAELFKSPDMLNKAPADVVVSHLIKEGNRVGGVDDIVARASRDVLRLKGQRLDDASVSDIFNNYGIKLPPTTDIKFQGYQSLDDEQQKVDGWAAQAKAAYNLKTKARHPELLAYRDETFQKIDDSAKYLKDKIGSTDSGAIDFLGRLGKGAASFLDSITLSGPANFIRKHVTTNPDWDGDVSSVIGESLGQVAALGGAAVGGAAAGAAVGIGEAALGTAGVWGAILSNVHGTQKQVYDAAAHDTGSVGVATDAATSGRTYAAAALGTLADISLLGTTVLGAGKVAKGVLGKAGEKLVGGALGESIAATAGKIDNLKEAAGLAGDVAWQGNKYGAVAALQGNLTDTTLGNYTNMKDKFEPYDLRNRAVDYLGGFTGGAGFAVAGHFMLPKDRVAPQIDDTTAKIVPHDAINYDDQLQQAGKDFMSADTTDQAAEANVNFVDTAAKQATSHLLQGEIADLPPEFTATGADPQDAKRSITTSSIYNGMKETLGDLINHPHVQIVAEAGLDFLKKARAYIPAPRPADVVKPEPVITATEPVTDVTNAESAIAGETPAVSETQTAVDEATVPTDNALTKLEDKFHVQTTALPGGGASHTFSLIGSNETKATGSKEAIAAGLSVDSTSIKGGPALRYNRNTYAVETAADGTPTSFTTISPTGEKTVDSTITTPEELTSKLTSIANKQNEATQRLKFRATNDLKAHDAYELAVPKKLLTSLPDPIRNFAENALGAGSGGGGIADERHAKADAYLASPQAFTDLAADNKLTPEQALAYIDRAAYLQKPNLRATKINGIKNPLYKPRVSAVNNLLLNLSHDVLGREGLEPAIKDAYAPKNHADVLQALGYNTPADIVQPTEPVAAPKVGLSDNPDFQKFALEERYQDKPTIDKLLADSQTNPKLAAVVRGVAGDTLVEHNIPEHTPLNDALDKIAVNKAMQTNRGSFKYIKDLPLGRTPFAVGNILERAGIPYQTSTNPADFESRIGPDPFSPLLPNTGKFEPDTGVTLAAPILRGQQAQLTGFHEMGEAALHNNPGLETTLASNPVTARSAETISHSMRDTQSTDPHEHLADAISKYLFSKNLKTPGENELAKTHPQLVSVLDNYAGDSANKDTNFAKLAAAVDAEDAIPDKQKLANLYDKAAAGYELGGEALLNRNQDKRTRLEKANDLANAAKIAFFDDSANVRDAASDLVKAGGASAQIGKDFLQYFTVFKNRQQTALIPQTAMIDSFGIMERDHGVTKPMINNFLDNNRIVNEKAFWEQTLHASNVTGEDFKKYLYGSPTIAELLHGDDDLKEYVDNVISNDGKAVADPDAVTTVLNELASKAIANGREDEIRGQLGHIKDLKLRYAINAAFDPTVTIGFKRPVEVLGQTARGNLQNSSNVNREVARQALDHLQNMVTPDQWAAMKNYSQEVMRPTVKYVIASQLAAGKISDRSAQVYLSNADNYATFQTALALDQDPNVPATIRRQEAMHSDKGPPLETTVLKLGGMKVAAELQNFSNSIADVYYALDKVKSQKTITPIAATANEGPGTNRWVTNQQNAFGKIQEMPLNELVDLKNKLTLEASHEKLEKNRPSYVVSAQNGDYVLHELKESSVEKLLHPVTKGDTHEVLQALNAVQTWARSGLTVNNLPFAAKTVVRGASNLYIHRAPKTTAPPTKMEMLNAVLKAPIFGVPLNKADIQLMKYTYNLANDYLSNEHDPSRFYKSLDDSFGSQTTLEDLMKNPYQVDILARQGFMPHSVNNDTVIGGAASANAPLPEGSVFASNDEGALERFVSGRPKTENIMRKASDYFPEIKGVNLAGKLTDGVEAYLTKMRHLNNVIALGQKLAGLHMYMQDGHDFNTAMDKANVYFGHPDLRGGGSARASIAPFFLYSTATLNNIRNLGSAVKGGAEGFVKDAEGNRNFFKDQRAARATGVGIRNTLLHALVLHGLAGAIYGLAKATGSNDDDANDQAAVVQRLVDNIPKSEAQTGNSIPFAFRDPRTGELHFPLPGLKSSEIDPSWTTVYLNLPFDHVTSAFQSIAGLGSDVLNSNVSSAAAAANFMQDSLGHFIPRPGPVVSAGIDVGQIASGENPTNLFTGEKAVQDQDYKEGGFQLGAKYAQFLGSEFVPFLPGPRKSPFDKGKLGELTGYSILDQLPSMLKLGIVKESNYGQIQKNAEQLNIRNEFAQQVDDAIPDSAKNYANRINELQREATRQLQVHRDQLMSQGENPKNAAKRAADLLPATLKEELITGSHWKRVIYDGLKEKAEIALRAGDTKAYEGFLADMDTSANEHLSSKG